MEYPVREYGGLVVDAVLAVEIAEASPCLADDRRYGREVPGHAPWVQTDVESALRDQHVAPKAS